MQCLPWRLYTYTSHSPNLLQHIQTLVRNLLGINNRRRRMHTARRPYQSTVSRPVNTVSRPVYHQVNIILIYQFGRF